MRLVMEVARSTAPASSIGGSEKRSGVRSATSGTARPASSRPRRAASRTTSGSTDQIISKIRSPGVGRSQPARQAVKPGPSHTIAHSLASGWSRSIGISNGPRSGVRTRSKSASATATSALRAKPRQRRSACR